MNYWIKWVGVHVVVVLSTLFCSSISMAGGGAFSESASSLSSRIYGRVINGGICATKADCNRKEVFFGDHDLAVSFYFYGPIHGDVLLGIIQDAMELSKSKKVPVELYFYEEYKRELIGVKKFFTKPRMEVEINI